MSKYGSIHMIHTDIYKPNPAKCCAACVFGSGEHEPWCSTRFDAGGYITSDGPAILHQDYVIPRAMAEEMKRLMEEKLNRALCSAGFMEEKRNANRTEGASD